MGMLDNFKEKASELADKAKGAGGGIGDKISEGVDKATDFVDEKTGGKFTDKLDAVDGAVDKAVGSDDETPAADA